MSQPILFYLFEQVLKSYFVTSWISHARRNFQLRHLCFETMYLYEQVLSVTCINKSKLNSRLMHERLNDIPRLATMQDLTPDMGAFTKEKR